MLDDRTIVCTTALEVRLLAALTEARRQLTRLKRPETIPPEPRGPGKPAPRSRAQPVTPLPPLRRVIDEPSEPQPEPAPIRKSRLDRLPAGEAKIIDIQQAVCQKFNITLTELRSNRRTNAICEVRHVAVMLCYALTLHSYPFIGRFFGGRDHSTMLHSVEKLESVRITLCSELTTRDSINTWVKHAFDLVRADRAKPVLPDRDTAAAKLVIDIKALREA